MTGELAVVTKTESMRKFRHRTASWIEPIGDRNVLPICCAFVIERKLYFFFQPLSPSRSCCELSSSNTHYANWFLFHFNNYNLWILIMAFIKYFLETDTQPAAGCVSTQSIHRSQHNKNYPRYSFSLTATSHLITLFLTLLFSESGWGRGWGLL